MMEENFGPVEEIEFFPRGDSSFAFVRFFMVQTAHLAFSNKDKIAELLETSKNFEFLFFSSHVPLLKCNILHK
jgi:hypothetical protein